MKLILRLGFPVLCLLCWFSDTVFSEYTSSESILNADNGRVRGFHDRDARDFIIGGLFAVHRSGKGGACSELVRSGPERVEAFLYALDLVNNDSNLLPGISLGYDIRDTCVSDSIALDESVDLLFSGTLNNECEASIASGSSLNVSSRATNSISAIIGPTTSQVSLSVANLLRLFNTPEVSYSVSSPILDDRDLYGYFYRTYPSDDLLAEAIVDLAIEYEWKYITAIHSNNGYGEPGIDRFKRLAMRANVCIDLDIGLDDKLSPSEYYEFAGQVITESTANVILFFASLSFVDSFMEQFSLYQENNNNNRHFLWIATDSWGQSTIIRSKYQTIIAGLLLFSPTTEVQSNFSHHFSQLTLSSNDRNPWFTEYYEGYFNCTVNVSCASDIPVTNHSDYVERTYIQLTIDAVFSVAHALNDFLQANCDHPIVWYSTSQTCQGQKQNLSGLLLRNYLQNVSFTSPSGNRIFFDEFGNIEGHYVLKNLQKNNGSYEFVDVASWVSSAEKRLEIFENASPQFGLTESGEPLKSIESQCQNCPLGSTLQSIPSSCCGGCNPCQGRNYTNSTNAYQCIECDQNMWGNDPVAGSHFCREIEETYLKPNDIVGIFLIIVAAVGLICVASVSIALAIYWNNPIIKSSGREQMTLLLVGITLCFLVTIFFILKPSIAVCLFRRIGVWFCFYLILSSLFIKLVRIARIFLRKQSSGRPRFIEPMYQIIFTFFLVGIQMILVIISLIVAHPGTTGDIVLNSKNTIDSPTIAIQCSSAHIAITVLQLFFYTALLVATNILGVITLRFPENFNEARYIAFSTFSSLLIWFAFMLTYIAVDSSYQSAVICFGMQLTALAVLFSIFVPRIFVSIVSHLTEGSDTKQISSYPVVGSGLSPFKEKCELTNMNKRFSDLPEITVNIDTDESGKLKAQNGENKLILPE